MPLHERALHACIEEMRAVVTSYRPEYADPETADDALWQEALAWYDLRQTACERIADQLMKNRVFQAKYMRKALVGEMITASQILLTYDDIEIEEGMARAIEHLERMEIEWRCLYPLSGIAFHDIDELELGYTTIRVMTKQYIDDWLEDMETTLGRAESLREDDRELWRRTYGAVIEGYRRQQVAENTTFPDKQRAQVYAEVRAIGDLHKAREIANAEIRSVIDILRYACIPLHIFDPTKARHIGLQGEYGQGPRRMEMIPATYLGRGHHATAGRLYPVLFDRGREARLTEWGVPDLGRLLRNPESEYILNAVHWFAESLTQSESGHAFLCLAVGLETLFGADQPEQRQGQKEFEPVAHGVAQIVGGEMATKQDTLAKVNQLYQVRNAVAHGRTRHVDESDLTLMRLAVQQVVRGIGTRAEDFSPKLRLLDWIRRQEPIPNLY